MASVAKKQSTNLQGGMESEGSSAGTMGYEDNKARGKKVTKFKADMENVQNATRLDMRAGSDPIKAYPINYSKAKTEREQVIALKHAALDGAPGKASGVTPYGVVQATDEDFKWILKREELKKGVEADQIFASLFDAGDPAQMALMRELKPEFFEERMKFIKRIASMQVLLAEIMLTGIRTREDLDFYIALQMMDPSQRDPTTGLPIILTKPVYALDQADFLNKLDSGDAYYNAVDGGFPMLNAMGNRGQRTAWLPGSLKPFDKTVGARPNKARNGFVNNIATAWGF